MTAPDRPLMRWHGGKWRIAPWIIAQMPRHDTYVEPFGGAGSVLMQKPRARAEVWNDLDSKAFTVFSVMRDPAQAAELRRVLELTPYSRDDFNDSYLVGADPVDQARRTIMMSFMGFGSDSVTRSCRTGFRATVSETQVPAVSWTTYPACVDAFTARLRGVLVENRPALTLMPRYDSLSTLFYVDPPYLFGTRSSLVGRSRKTHGYRHELSDEDHDELLGSLCQLKGMVLLSAYASERYSRRLKGWSRIELDTLADGAKARREILWINPACQRALDAQRMPLFEGHAA